MAARTTPAPPGTGGPEAPGLSAHPVREQRAAAGKAARQLAPLASHRDFDAPASRDPVGLLLGQAESRVPELVPVRHGRMLVSPFTYYRGAALPMAADLEILRRDRRHERRGDDRLRPPVQLDARPRHARTGDRIAIAAYLGRSDKFDQAIAEFSETYADQTERDHAALADAVASRRVQAQMGT